MASSFAPTRDSYLGSPAIAYSADHNGRTAVSAKNDEMVMWLTASRYFFSVMVVCHDLRGANRMLKGRLRGITRQKVR